MENEVNEEVKYDLSQLTAKNQDYVHSLKNQLSLIGRSESEIEATVQEILPEIVEAQKKGVTARGLYGAPTSFADNYKKKIEDKSLNKNKNPYLMILDSALLIFGILGGANGLLLLVNASQAYYGLTSLILSSIVGGIGLYRVYVMQSRNLEKYNSGQEITKSDRRQPIILTIVYMLIWIGVTVLSMAIKGPANPIIPPLFLVIVALIALGARYLLKKQFNVQSASVSQPLPAQARTKKKSK